MEKKVLHLSVSKQWYDMLASGEKKEEYREIKDYWTKRLLKDLPVGFRLGIKIGTIRKPWHPVYTHVLFINGYGDDKPRVEKEIESISIGKPRKGWCPDEFLDKEYFVIKLK